MSTISAITLKNIADSYFKVIDRWYKEGEGEVAIVTGDTTILGVSGSSITAATINSELPTTTAVSKYWIILLQDDVFYLIFLNPTASKLSAYLATYSTTTGWTNFYDKYSYEFIKHDVVVEDVTENIVTGIKLSKTDREYTFNYGYEDTINEIYIDTTIIATLNGDNSSFKWSVTTRTNITTGLGDNAVIYNGANMKVDLETDNYVISGNNKYDKLLNSDFGVDGHVKPTEGYITITGKIIEGGASTDPNVYVTWFRKDGNDLYLGNGNTENFSQKVTLITGALDKDGTTGQYTVTLPVYSGLYGGYYTVSMLYQKLDLNEFKTFVDKVTDNGNDQKTLKDPRNFLFSDPSNISNQTTTLYPKYATTNIVNLIPKYRKFITNKTRNVSDSFCQFLAVNDVKSTTTSLVTIRLDKSGSAAVYFMYNSYDTSNNPIIESKPLYSASSPLKYFIGESSGYKVNDDDGFVNLDGNYNIVNMPIQDLSLFNYQLKDLYDSSISDGERNFKFDNNTRGIKLVDLLLMDTFQVTLSNCYKNEFKITNDTLEYDDLNLICYNSEIEATTTAATGLTFENLNGKISGLNKYTIVIQLNLSNIDAIDADNSYFGIKDNNNKPVEGGKDDIKYVLLYIEKDEDSYSVIQKWSDESGCSKYCDETNYTLSVTVEGSTITIKNSNDLETSSQVVIEGTTGNQGIYKVNRLCAFENGIPRNAEAHFSSGVETTDDYLNIYNCKIVALYGPVNDPAPSQTDTPFLNVFIGNVDMRSVEFDYSSSTFANYNDFKGEVDTYITDKGEEKVTDFGAAYTDITTVAPSIKAYYIMVFVKYVYKYSMYVKQKDCKAKMYHYYKSLLKYIPSKDTSNIKQDTDNNYYYEKGDVIKFVINNSNNLIEMKYENSTDKFIVFGKTNGIQTINFPELCIYTLDDIVCHNLSAFVKTNDNNDIQDFIASNGCNIANIVTYNGSSSNDGKENKLLFALDFDSNETRKMEDIEVETLIIRCIPVK